MSSDSVNDSAATHGEHVRPQESKTTHELAINLLKEKAAAGSDFVNNELSRKQADALAIELNARHKTDIKGGVFYKARATIRGGKMQEIQKVVGENLGGEVKKPASIFDNGGTLKVEDLLAGGDSEAKGSGQQAAAPSAPGQPAPKKQFEPLPMEHVKTIVDVCVDGVADALQTALQKPIAPKSVNAAKATYNATLEAYNASLPKWLLLPACLLVTVFVFVIPARAAIAGKVKGKAKLPPMQDAAPAIQETVQEIQRTSDPFFSQ